MTEKSRRFLCGLCNTQFAADKSFFAGPTARCPNCGADHSCGEYAAVVHCPNCGEEQFRPLDLMPGTAVACTGCSVKFSMEDAEGTEIPLKTCFPDYEIRQRLERDDSGIVYLVRHKSQKKEYLLKILTEETGWSAGTEAELQRVRALSHPALVRIEELGKDSCGRSYMVAERRDEVSLAALMQARRLTAKEVISIGIRMFEGLSALEQAGIPHGRLTPAHILIDSAGGVRMTAPELAGTEAAEHYMSPEQCRSGAPGSRSDLYSAGAVLYHAACGKMPYDGLSGDALRERILQGPPESLRNAAPQFPPEVSAVIRDLMQRQPALRPSGAAVAWAWLGNVLTVPRAGFRARHPRLAAWFYGIAVLLLILAGIWCLLPAEHAAARAKGNTVQK